MYTLPPVPEQETFVTVANAVEKATQPPHSKRLRTSAHSDLHDKPERFQVAWTQDENYYPADNNLLPPFKSVSVQLPIQKPIAPGSFRVALERVRVKKAHVISSSASNVNQTDRISGVVSPSGSIFLEVGTRNLTEPPVFANGHQRPVEIFTARNVRFPIVGYDDGASEYTLDFEATQDVDPSLAHHPIFVPSSGDFSFDVYLVNPLQAASEGPPFECEAQFVIFPDPWWTRL